MGVDHVEATFEARPGSVRACRSFVEATLAAWDCDDPDQIAVLLTSELVTNAVVHAGSDIQVGLAVFEETLQVEVTDGSHKVPALHTLKDREVGGKGIWLVHQLAQAWGTRPTAEGKTVWFRMDIVRRRPSGFAS
jgi:anti-sigma regulatory factor (Ser/Thr protein kinase)